MESMNIMKNKFARTFKDLFLDPMRVLQKSSEYLNPWQFTLLLFGSTLFIGYFLRSISDQPDISHFVNERLAQFWDARDNFYENFEAYIELIKTGIVTILLSLVLFKKARLEFNDFFKLVIYALGIVNTIVYGLMLVNQVMYSLGVELPMEVIELLGTIYLVYVFTHCI